MTNIKNGLGKSFFDGIISGIGNFYIKSSFNRLKPDEKERITEGPVLEEIAWKLGNTITPVIAISSILNPPLIALAGLTNLSSYVYENSQKKVDDEPKIDDSKKAIISDESLTSKIKNGSKSFFSNFPRKAFVFSATYSILGVLAITHYQLTSNSGKNLDDLVYSGSSDFVNIKEESLTNENGVKTKFYIIPEVHINSKDSFIHELDFFTNNHVDVLLSEGYDLPVNSKQNNSRVDLTSDYSALYMESSLLAISSLVFYAADFTYPQVTDIAENFEIDVKYLEKSKINYHDQETGEQVVGVGREGISTTTNIAIGTLGLYVLARSPQLYFGFATARYVPIGVYNYLPDSLMSKVKLDVINERNKLMAKEACNQMTQEPEKTYAIRIGALHERGFLEDLEKECGTVTFIGGVPYSGGNEGITPWF